MCISSFWNPNKNFYFLLKKHFLLKVLVTQHEQISESEINTCQWLQLSRLYEALHILSLSFDNLSIHITPCLRSFLCGFWWALFVFPEELQPFVAPLRVIIQRPKRCSSSCILIHTHTHTDTTTLGLISRGQQDSKLLESMRNELQMRDSVISVSTLVCMGSIFSKAGVRRMTRKQLQLYTEQTQSGGSFN